VVARLVDGPVRDVNWMTRRDRASGDASLVHVDDELVLYDDNTVALVVDGELELGGDRLRRLDLACGPATLTGFGLVVLARCVRT
jgi:environmental stress-induced protein Ves